MVTDDSEAGRKLTPKMRVFCHEYVKDWNGSRAARVAGYKDDTASRIAYANLQKPHVKAYLEHIQADLAKLSGISAVKILDELSKIAFSSIAQLHNSWIELEAFEALTEDQKAAIESIDTKTEIKEGANGSSKTVQYVKIKLYNKIAAIESINKMLSYNAPTKTDVTTKGQAITPGAALTQDQVNKLIEKL
jgi:phage terminase small subunit